MRAKRLLIGILLISLSGGCWWRKSAPAAEGEAPVAPAPDSIELYLSRSNLSSTEFEQYKLSAGKLFVECGKILAGRATPATQLVLDADESLAGAASRAAAEIHDAETGSLDEPGDNRGLIDPGQVYLTLAFGERLESLRTSLDSVSEPSSSGERKLNALAKILRGAAPEPPCGNAEFYGLGSEPVE